jgi:salicylate hydroxylase
LSESRVIHRTDYQKILLQEAQKLGAEIQTGAEVVGVNSENEVEQGQVCLNLKGGQRVYGNVVIGADGMEVQIVAYFQKLSI